MTTAYPSPRPQPEAAPVLLAPPDPGPSSEIIRHILIGSPGAIRDTIMALHQRRYVQQFRWTGPLEIGPNGVHITHEQGQMLAYLMRLRAFDAHQP